MQQNRVGEKGDWRSQYVNDNTPPAVGTTMWGRLGWMIFKNNEMKGAVPDGQGGMSEKRGISNSWRQ